MQGLLNDGARSGSTLTVDSRDQKVDVTTNFGTKCQAADWGRGDRGTENFMLGYEIAQSAWWGALKQYFGKQIALSVGLAFELLIE